MAKCTCKKGVAKKCSDCRPKKPTGMRATSRKLKPTPKTGMRATSRKLKRKKTTVKSISRPIRRKY